MRSNPVAVDEAWLLDGLDEFTNAPSTYLAGWIDGGDLLDDDGAVADYFALPRSVDDVLAEVALFGTGPEAITLLESLHGRAMSPDHALAVAEAWERQARWLSVRTADANVAFVGVTVAKGRDAAREQSSRVLELALATDVGDQFLRQVLLPQARLLASTLSATRAEVESGRLSAFRGRKICEKLAGLAERDPEVARGIEAQVLTNAAQIKVASLTGKLRRLVLAARDPEEALTEHLDGVANRRLRVDSEPVEPGLLGVHAYLPAETAVAFRTAVEAKAAEFAVADQRRAAQEAAAAAQRGDVLPAGTAGTVGVAGGADDGVVPGDAADGGLGLPFRPRTKDQRLADALAWFVLGPDPADASRPARPRFTVQLTMSLPVLLALRDGAAELPGYGPIPADLAREWAGDADWQRFVHDPVDGYLLDDGHRRYRPKNRMRRFTQHRDVIDRFPGSNRKAEDCDADHIEPFTGDEHGGSTSSRSLASAGRPGHIAKTHNGWTVTGDANAVLTWTSPHGLVRHTRPHDYRDPEAPPSPPKADLGPPPF